MLSRPEAGVAVGDHRIFGGTEYVAAKVTSVADDESPALQQQQQQQQPQQQAHTASPFVHPVYAPPRAPAYGEDLMVGSVASHSPPPPQPITPFSHPPHYSSHLKESIMWASVSRSLVAVLVMMAVAATVLNFVLLARIVDDDRFFSFAPTPPLGLRYANNNDVILLTASCMVSLFAVISSLALVGNASLVRVDNSVVIFRIKGKSKKRLRVVARPSASGHTASGHSGTNSNRVQQQQQQQQQQWKQQHHIPFAAVGGPVPSGVMRLPVPGVPSMVMAQVPLMPQQAMHPLEPSAAHHSAYEGSHNHEFDSSPSRNDLLRNSRGAAPLAGEPDGYPGGGGDGGDGMMDNYACELEDSEVALATGVHVQADPVMNAVHGGPRTGSLSRGAGAWGSGAEMWDNEDGSGGAGNGMEEEEEELVVDERGLHSDSGEDRPDDEPVGLVAKGDEGGDGGDVAADPDAPIYDPWKDIPEDRRDLVDKLRQLTPFCGMEIACCEMEGGSPESGISVINLLGDGPADNSGVLKNDVIKAIDGVEVGDTAAYRVALQSMWAGEICQLSIVRDSEPQENVILMQVGAPDIELEEFKTLCEQIGGPDEIRRFRKLFTGHGTVVA